MTESNFNSSNQSASTQNAGSALNNDSNPTIARIKNQISSHPVLLYMKGSPDFPSCGFSARVAQILNHLNTHYAYVDILNHPEIRSTLPKYANWPTFPQLYIRGELIGGCDIVTEMFEKDELQPLLESANALGDTPVTVMAD